MNNQPDKKALAVLGIAVVLLLAYVCMGVAEGAHAAEPMECSDEYMPPAITAPDRAGEYTARLVDEARDAAEAELAEIAEQEGLEIESFDGEYVTVSDGYGGGYSMPYSDLYGKNGPVVGMPGWYGDAETGHVETMYNASSHYMASEWTVDGEGFYRDSEGRYVIGVSIDDINPETGQGYQYGDVVQTGKGEAVVYDYGQGVDNVHDFATIHY